MNKKRASWRVLGGRGDGSAWTRVARTVAPAVAPAVAPPPFPQTPYLDDIWTSAWT